MGIFCKISVVNPPNDEFTPGSVVCGSIKYAFDKEVIINKIDVSLKGRGKLVIKEETGDSKTRIITTDQNTEDYVYIEKGIHCGDGRKSLPIGEYDTSFNFTLPEDIPPSLNYKKCFMNYDVNCKISYCIRIKFEIPGVFTFDKKFDNEIKVVSGIKPRLLIEPLIYGARKQLFQPFRSNKSIVNLKACIKNSVLEPGGKVEVVYEVVNDTNKTIQSIETKLVEVYTFYKHQNNEKSVIKTSTDIAFTESKTSAIQSGDTVENTLEIDIPQYLHSLDYSKIVKRDYAVVIKVNLPIPYTNMPVEIPIQVGNNESTVKRFITDTNIESLEDYDESPPSYWKTMNECIDKGGTKSDILKTKQL